MKKLAAGELLADESTQVKDCHDAGQAQPKLTFHSRNPTRRKAGPPARRFGGAMQAAVVA